MQLKIKPSRGNSFPLGGLLIKGTSVAEWMREIQVLGLSLDRVSVYPIPDDIPNSIWGCLVYLPNNSAMIMHSKHEMCQQVAPQLLIPEHTSLFPALSTVELEKLFSKSLHVFHPAFGLVELTEALTWEERIAKPQSLELNITRPSDSVYLPYIIKSFQISLLSHEEVLENMDATLFPKHEKMKDEPLSLVEKAKLAIYKKVFGEEEKGAGQVQINPLLGMVLGTFAGAFGNLGEKMLNDAQMDFEALEKRNQSQLNRLMDMFERNPDEALKYAIPLDENNTNRGGDAGLFDLMKRWDNFSVFGNSSVSGGSGNVTFGDSYYELQNRYNKTAEQFLKQKEYHKAAFVYMKLLKNYYKAAEVLEAGEFYMEAATIYLKHAHNKNKAAECYEKGNMIADAIALQKELNDHEKVGDLYTLIKKHKEAKVYYELKVEELKATERFVKASLLVKNKMLNKQLGQTILLEGWEKNKDAFNCLNNYFANIDEVDELGYEIKRVYTSEVSSENREIFLTVLKHEHAKGNKFSDDIKEMAYEIVALQLVRNPSIVVELKHFNANDKELMKDALRFKLNKP